MPRTFAVALTAGALLWAAVLFVVPVALTAGGPAATGAALVYVSASRICHQRPERSFTVAGAPMPVCGRCAGLYLSGALGAVLAWGPRRRRRGGERLVLALCALPTAATWGLEAAGIAAFPTAIRAAAAVPLGAVAGWLFVRSLRDEARQAAPLRADARPRAL